MIDTDLQEMERATFRAAADSGLWDIVLACPFVMLAIAPLLSDRLGDYLSAAVFLPFFVAVFVVIRLVQVRVIQPRIGVVEFARPRQRRLAWLNVIMLFVNVVALVSGLFAFTRAPVVEGQVVSIGLSLVLLIGCSSAALFLGIPRLFFYGLMLAAAPPIGEALFSRGLASHHGFPIVFGVCAAVIVVSGIVRFLRFLPPPQSTDELPLAEAADE